MLKKLRKIINSRNFEIFLIFLILVGAVLVRLYKIENPVADWHSWRQADTASVSRTFLEQGIDLLRPRYHDISKVQTGYFNPDGWRMLEFPIFNLAHVALFGAFGRFSFDMWGRLVSVLAATGTTAAMYFLGRKLVGKWEGLLSAFFYAFIPFNIYFTRVILPDPLAVFFATSALVLFLYYLDSENRLYLFLSSIAFAFGLLTKPQTIFYSVPIAYFGWRKFGVKGIFQNKSLLLAIDIALIPFLLWRAWIDNPPYLKGIAHIAWAFNGDGIRFRPSFWRWIFGERIGILILGGWGLLPFTFGILSLGEKKKYKWFASLFLIGMVGYMTVLASANVRHDYYQTYIMPAVAVTLALGSMYLVKAKEFKWYLRWGLLIFSIGMMFNMGIDRIRGNYQINNPVIIEAGEAADKVLPKGALVIAPYNGDTAFLYQTRRWGWPVVNDDITKMIEKGAQYFVSVNNDRDTATFRERFEVVEDNERYTIINLQIEK